MRQEYDKYTDESHQVWNILFDRQMEILPERASVAFLDGLNKVGFEPHRIPNFDEVNAQLKNLTGWQLHPVPGIVDNTSFFELLSQKLFPATTWLRKMEELDYLEEPDMFHDVFGHVPILSNPDFCQFLEGMSKIALKHIDNDWVIELITRLYWYTVEFGLIKENGMLKIYGAGILSSNGESIYCLDNPKPKRAKFDINHVLQTGYIKEVYQNDYFIIDSYEQLYKSLPELEEHINWVAEEAITK